MSTTLERNLLEWPVTFNIMEYRYQGSDVPENKNELFMSNGKKFHCLFTNVVSKCLPLTIQLQQWDRFCDYLAFLGRHISQYTFQRFGPEAARGTIVLLLLKFEVQFDNSQDFNDSLLDSIEQDSLAEFLKTRLKFN